MPTSKSGNPISLNSPKGLKSMNRILIWTAACRPKTLIASISPVLIGTTLAMSQRHFDLQNVPLHIGNSDRNPSRDKLC